MTAISRRDWGMWPSTVARARIAWPAMAGVAEWQDTEEGNRTYLRMRCRARMKTPTIEGTEYVEIAIGWNTTSVKAYALIPVSAGGAWLYAYDGGATLADHPTDPVNVDADTDADTCIPFFSTQVVVGKTEDSVWEAFASDAELLGFELSNFYDNAYSGGVLEVADYEGDWASTVDGPASSCVVSITADAYNSILYSATQSMSVVIAGEKYTA